MSARDGCVYISSREAAPPCVRMMRPSRCTAVSSSDRTRQDGSLSGGNVHLSVQRFCTLVLLDVIINRWEPDLREKGRAFPVHPELVAAFNMALGTGRG